MVRMLGLFARQRFFSPIILRDDKDPVIKVWGYSKTVYEKLLNKVINPEYGDITDPETSGGYRSSVVMTELRKHLPELNRDDYADKASMDVNGMFRPFSTKPGATTLSSFESSGVSYSSSGDLSSINMFYTKEQLPPVTDEKHLPIVMETLSPFLDGDMVDTYLLGTSKGHDIEYIARDGVYPTHLSVRHPSDNYSSDHWYRGIALKGPLILAGWGYDIDNKPVPNSHPDYPVSSNLRFKDDWLRKPQDWKCGPLDVRWDYNRKVWTAPPSMKIVTVKALETIVPHHRLFADRSEGRAMLLEDRVYNIAAGRYDFDIQDEVKDLGLDKALKELEKTHECVDGAYKSMYARTNGKKPSSADLEQMAEDFGGNADAGWHGFHYPDCRCGPVQDRVAEGFGLPDASVGSV